MQDYSNDYSRRVQISVWNADCSWYNQDATALRNRTGRPMLIRSEGGKLSAVLPYSRK